MKLIKTRSCLNRQGIKKPFGFAALCALLALMLVPGCSDDPPSLPPKAPTTWTLAEGIDSTATIYKIAYGKNVFVATGGTGSAPYAAWSSDGVTWHDATDITALGTGDKRYYVYFGGDLFVASDGRNGSSNTWVKSADGKIWEAISGASAFAAAAGYYGNGKYLICGTSGKIAYTTSITGTWTIKDNTVTDFAASGSNSWINAGAYGKNIYLAGGGTGRIIRSTDAETWTAAKTLNSPDTTTLFDNGFVCSLTFGDGRFIAVGGQDDAPNPTKVAYSDDGETWTESLPSATNKIAGAASGARYSSSAYGDGIFVMTARDGSASYSTDNGVTWTLIDDNPIGTTTPNSVCYGKGMFLIGGGGKIAYSTPE